MNIIEAIILGLVQGLTEFLPVSSSGHIELGTFLLGVKAADNLLFSVVVHAATALSTVVVFRKDIVAILLDLLKFRWNEGTKLAMLIAVSMVPVGLVGVFFEKEVEAFFGGKIIFVGAMLMVTATLLTVTHFASKRSGEVTFGRALVIGLAQMVAILPGISRSGATICTALLVGVSRENAARFSFLMVLPPILGACLLKVLKFVKEPAMAEGVTGGVLTAGFLAAFLAGLAACVWMISIVKRGKLIYFAIYCAVVGLVAVVGGLMVGAR
ncbi:undecaprenyl-diphosphate phosphatase [Phragmitibacter flavus]|uniref:Undecaprenyl-diphosphatase n=1 Tax=Phragmitibacter flavus TaxID=2576071 RepID=A0A5R8KGK1_9BACT|nr:undecaprenyl-diphosphate phosphatase [Phragmitibacter flavus]TLD71434.1 undecaprenyl-diphosphate phosphatase [Phragmitibacter flavus]